LRNSADAPPSILLLGLLAALPGFGVDMALPALASTAATFGVPTQSASLTVSSYMVSFGMAPLIYGPLSDRCGRKPVVIIGCAIFVIAGVGCVFAPTLSMLLAYRVIQGGGAAAMTLAMVIARDAYNEAVLRQKISYIMLAIFVSPIAAPSAGAALLALAGWQSIYASLVVFGILVLIGVWFGIDEGPLGRTSGRLRVLAIAGDYRRVLSHPACRGYLIAGAASFGVVAAYATGSSLFLVKAVGLSPNQFSMIFGASALASAGGALLDSQLAARGISSSYSVSIGLIIVLLVSAILLVMALIDWAPIPITVSMYAATMFGAGMIAPGITQGALQQVPQMSGAISAASNCLAMMAGSLSGWLSAVFFDGRTMLSLSGTMFLCSLLALISFSMVTRYAARQYT
jgi:MFS transporter, DHA1 family, multidrug resistance protein